LRAGFIRIKRKRSAGSVGAIAQSALNLAARDRRHAGKCNAKE
jgi:hypothetical protein